MKYMEQCKRSTVQQKQLDCLVIDIQKSKADKLTLE